MLEIKGGVVNLSRICASGHLEIDADSSRLQANSGGLATRLASVCTGNTIGDGWEYAKQQGGACQQSPMHYLGAESLHYVIRSLGESFHPSQHVSPTL